ncbi:hypothetical protein BDY21DRAFT_419916 [Lineolata rhizophorae]|uniref:Uncharacterized protein n=1 Tax=Lineolata rhizophorae TaxID=578093 RepID=A0A6A6P681_9PEZI|nr:hypothetical protein BDY21DRAFT_419916 [Lineolata rhizophorae]
MPAENLILRFRLSTRGSQSSSRLNCAFPEIFGRRREISGVAAPRLGNSSLIAVLASKERRKSALYAMAGRQQFLSSAKLLSATLRPWQRVWRWVTGKFKPAFRGRCARGIAHLWPDFKRVPGKAHRRLVHRNHGQLDFRTKGVHSGLRHLTFVQNSKRPQKDKRQLHSTILQTGPPQTAYSRSALCKTFRSGPTILSRKKNVDQLKILPLSGTLKKTEMPRAQHQR